MFKNCNVRWTNRFVGLLFFYFLTSWVSAKSPVFKTIANAVSEDGHIKLEWEMSIQDEIVEVQQSLHEDFSSAKIIYTGPDNATFISGLQNGTYYYRIKRVNNDWSDNLVIEVRHHSLKLAFILFGLGAVVFSMTAWVVIKGAIQTSSY